MTKSSLRHHLLDKGIKALILILLSWAIYQQVVARHHLDDLWQTFVVHMQEAPLIWLLATLTFVPLNWALETLKWRVFTNTYSSVSFWQSYRAVLAGITVSLFTPNRVGEYGGRILLVEAKDNWRAVVATLIGSYTQLLVLLSMGLLGLAYFSLRQLQVVELGGSWLLLLAGTLVILMLIGFFNISKLVKVLKKWVAPKYLRRFFRHIIILKNYKRRRLWKALGLGWLRYATYTLQYFFMLQFFGILVPIDLAFSGIATIFFLQTSIPLPPLMGLVTRGEIALFIWGQFGAPELNILACTFSLFIINLLFPALLGAGFILQTNLLKSLGYDNEMDV